MWRDWLKAASATARHPQPLPSPTGHIQQEKSRLENTRSEGEGVGKGDPKKKRRENLSGKPRKPQAPPLLLLLTGGQQTNTTPPSTPQAKTTESSLEKPAPEKENLYTPQHGTQEMKRPASHPGTHTEESTQFPISCVPETTGI